MGAGVQLASQVEGTVAILPEPVPCVPAGLPHGPTPGPAFREPARRSGQPKHCPGGGRWEAEDGVSSSHLQLLQPLWKSQGLKGH